MGKVRVNITLDEELVELSRTKLGVPLSYFLNSTLKEALNATDEIKDLRKEINQYENSLIALRAKLCKLEREEHDRLESREGYSDAMNTLRRIHDKHGVVGENQIKNVAGLRELDYDELLDCCNSEHLTVVKAFEPNQVGRMKNGGALR